MTNNNITAHDLLGMESILDSVFCSMLDMGISPGTSYNAVFVDTDDLLFADEVTPGELSLEDCINDMPD